MSRELWMTLADNAAILIALFLIIEISYIITRNEKLQKIISGVLISGISIAIMSLPYQLLPGVIFDTRTILISVTAMVLGVVPTAITAVVTILYRLYLGGTGAPAGIAFVVTSAAIGLLWRRWFFKTEKIKRWIHAYLMSLATHVAMILCLFLLPYPQSIDAISQVAFPVMIIFPIASLTLSSLLVHQKERIDFQEKLKKSEKKYRNIINNISDVVWTTDMDLNITYVSPSVIKLFDETPEDYLHRKLKDKFSPESIKLIYEMLQEELKKENTGKYDKNRSREVELEYRKNDGSYIWLAMNISFLRNENGTIVGLQGVSRNITGRKRAELELQNERDKIRTYLEIAKVLFLAIDKNMKITLVNKEGCNVLGDEKENILGSDWVDKYIPENDRAKYRKWLNDVLMGVEQDYKVHVITVVDSKGNEKIISWRNALLRDTTGNISGIVASGVDITEQEKTLKALEESERSKSVFISHIPGLAYRCAYDKEWTMEFISDGCCELTGYKIEDFINNNKLSYNSIICDHYKKEVWDEWTKVILNKESYKGEYEIRTASGETKWVLEMGQPIYDKNGNVEALEGIVIDIDESKKRFDQIQYMNDHDFLTGLYNRRYFEAEKRRLDTEENLPISITIADINGLKLINDAFGHSEGDALIINAGAIIKQSFPEKAVIARTGGDEFGVILPNADLKQTNRFIKKIEKLSKNYNENLSVTSAIVNISIGTAIKESGEKSIEVAEKEAEDNMYRHKLLDRESHHNAIITSVMATMFAKSQETEEHAQRMADHATRMGQKLGLSQRNLDNLKLLSMLHDIGKIGIDDTILNKPGPLNESEWEIMKKHPEIGYRIAMTSSELKPIAQYILHHHERWDGSGYPEGLMGNEIPLLARIISIVDAYDAMTNDRIYRKALPIVKAKKELIKYSGTQFDPELVDVFIEVVD